MRRLLFNPLAQQPYASGVYDIVNHYFVVDKKIELNHVYYLVFETPTSDSQTCAIVDTRNLRYEKLTSAFPFLNANGKYSIFFAKIDENHITLQGFGVNATSDEEYNVYIYQLM